ncbi:MAG: ribosome biogenesis GTP-binding protein YsxC [Deltaproteobacteria bacterium]|nr:MAG: ribosome biogenesis GTP-binding protein YsxC [Deltaproteobacteria bacterium]
MWRKKLSVEIIKGSAKFIRGFDDAGSFLEWITKNTNIRGLAFVGRSNTGKSTTINKIFGKSTARVSKTPGRTRQINIFEFKMSDVDETFYLFDLPGYGHAQVSKEMLKNWRRLMETFFMNAPRGMTMVNIQDARHPNQKADQAFYDYFKNFALDVMLAFNKMDKLRTQKEKASIKKAALEFKKVRQIHFISAEKGTGVDALTQALVASLLRPS